jgi:cell wall assembly regulator SMI1
MTIRASWQRIERWLARHAHGHELPPGALPEEIERAEAVLGVKFPPDLQVSYLLHDGSGEIQVFDHGALMPLDAVTVVWELMRDILREPETPPEAWDLAFIPISDDASGDHLVVDTQPPGGGPPGQILFWWHELTGEVADIAPSFATLLAERADLLESDRAYRFDAEQRKILNPARSLEMPRALFHPRRR